MKQKANISIELWAWNVTIRFDLGHDFDYEFSGSNLEFAISQPKMVWLPQNEKYAYRMNLKASMTIKFDLGHDLERWGVRIYQIVTRMTSDVSMPSTSLVILNPVRWCHLKPLVHVWYCDCKHLCILKQYPNIAWYVKDSCVAYSWLWTWLLYDIICYRCIKWMWYDDCDEFHYWANISIFYVFMIETLHIIQLN